MQDNKLFYVGLKAFIGKKGKLLITTETSNYEGGQKWGLPGGRIQEGEESIPLKDILAREIREECGDIHIDIGEPFTIWRRPPHQGGQILLIGFHCLFQSGEIKMSEASGIGYEWISEKDIDRYHFVDGYKEAIMEFFRKPAI